MAHKHLGGKNRGGYGKEAPGKDTRGVYRREIGWKAGNGTHAIRQLFRLGRDPEKAKLANMRLEELWEAVVARWKRLKGEGKTDEPCPLWDDVTLQIGKSISHGESVCMINVPCGMEAMTPYALAHWLAALQVEFPMMPLRLPPQLTAKSAQAIVERTAQFQAQLDGIVSAEQIDNSILVALGEQPQPTGQTLHQALDAYSAHLAEKYQDRPSLRPQQTSLALLRRHFEDCSLSQVDADKIETWLAYWCRRPNGQEGKPLALTTCRNVLIDLRRFLRWLARSSRFQWDMPGGFTFHRCRISKVAADRVRKRAWFKLEELKTIWAYAKPWERALILLALNCGFSKREIATLQPGEVVTNSKGRTFIKRHRTKTEVYGEWVLWPETIEALAYLKQFQGADKTYLVHNTAGTDLARGTRTGNENQIIKNHWDHLWARIHKDHTDIPKLPFKHLRKTGATYLRHMHIPNAAELASMYLAHGEHADSADSLLPVYASRPWKKLHKALLRLRKKLLPILTSVADPWTYKTVRTSPLLVEKVKALRAEGKKLKEIASLVGLHYVTVGKICRGTKKGEAREAPGSH
jgi:integrase